MGYGKLNDRVWIGEDHKLPLAFGRDELAGQARALRRTYLLVG